MAQSVQQIDEGRVAGPGAMHRIAAPGSIEEALQARAAIGVQDCVHPARDRRRRAT
jgi:hypothetical protein